MEELCSILVRYRGYTLGDVRDDVCVGTNANGEELQIYHMHDMGIPLVKTFLNEHDGCAHGIFLYEESNSKKFGSDRVMAVQSMLREKFTKVEIIPTRMVLFNSMDVYGIRYYVDTSGVSSSGRPTLPYNDHVVVQLGFQKGDLIRCEIPDVTQGLRIDYRLVA
ncbi:MAG: hypothetical protein CMK92_00740 [Pseudomonas sp.]|nr:hypothetical protein [Pseudomonas sp.]